ncbi:MAG: sigma-70 family RNA polymerase sigma factor [Polyangiaceae bacterium]|nr:sigma-70 family RNA polymerase sigma factor [Polyangiaceae bacterium]
MISHAGPARRGFASTRWSVVLRAAGAPTPNSRAALEELCRAYRPPLLDFAQRIEANPERAEDLVQGFFAHILEQAAHEERNVIGEANPERGRFRSFLRTAFHNYVRNVRNKGSSLRNGGRVPHDDVNGVDLENGAPLADRLYDRAWAQALLARALSRLGEEEARAGRGALFEALRDRLTDDDSVRLREVGKRLGMTENHVKVSLHRMWKRYGKVLRDEVAQTVARSEDVDTELRHLLASWIDDEPY